MSIFLYRALGRVCLTLFVTWAQPLLAVTPSTDGLSALVDRTLRDHPEILAAEAAIEAARARLDGAALPLNNPEFAIEAERTDIDTLRLGLSQTLDWHGKREVLASLAQAGLEASRARLDSLRLRLANELLDAIGRIVTQREILALAQRRTQLMQRFARLAGRRLAAGDIGQSERGLARLSLAEARLLEARRKAGLITAEGDFSALAGRPLQAGIELPSLPSATDTSDTGDAVIDHHPQVREALAEARSARARIRVADITRKADPTLGLAAGRESDENLLALSFSMPLQLRNDFRSEVEAARAEALRAEQLAHQRRRALRARWEATRAGYQVTDAAWKQWRSQGQGSLKQRFRLLERQWRAGEMSTSDYLVQLQQTLDTQIAGIELRGARWAAWLAWRTASGRILP